MLIRRETAADIPAVRAVTGAAFAKPDTPVPAEVTILDRMRTGPDWLPPLSLVAIGDQGEVVGHAVCSRGYVDGVPVGEPLVALVGNPAYYGRYGFRTATDHGITPPDPAWGDAFQVRTLSAYEPTLRGTFTFAEAFDLA